MFIYKNSYNLHKNTITVLKDSDYYKKYNTNTLDDINIIKNEIDNYNITNEDNILLEYKK